MRPRYEKPGDPAVLLRKRREIIARRVYRWTNPPDDKARRWWSLSDLYQSLGDAKADTWFRLPPMEHFFSEFLAALEAEAFDARGKTRVALLDPREPTVDSATRRLLVRLDHVRGRDLKDTDGWAMFLRAGQLWIEIDRAFTWLLTWLDPPLFVQHWSRMQPIARALQAAASAKLPPETASAGGSTASQAAAADAAPPSTEPQSVSAGAAVSSASKSGIKTTIQLNAEVTAEGWLRQRVAGGNLPSRNKVHEAAVIKFPKLTGRGFDRIWDAVAKDFPEISKPGRKAPKKTTC